VHLYVPGIFGKQLLNSTLSVSSEDQPALRVASRETGKVVKITEGLVLTSVTLWYLKTVISVFVFSDKITCFTT